MRYDEPGLSAGEREAYAAMLCDDDDDRRMETQTSLAIGPPAFVQRFTESRGHLRPRRGRPPKCARVSMQRTVVEMVANNVPGICPRAGTAEGRWRFVEQMQPRWKLAIVGDRADTALVAIVARLSESEELLLEQADEIVDVAATFGLDIQAWSVGTTR